MGTIWTNMSEVFTFTGSSNGLFQDNYVHDTDQLGPSTYNGANNITFRHNKLEYISIKRDGTAWFNNPSTAIYADSGYSIIIERNFVNHAGVGFEALSEPGQPATHDVTIRNNVVENCQRGIVLGTWYSYTDGSSVFRIDVFNNTFYGNDVALVVRPMVSSTVAWENNIFANNIAAYVNTLNWNPGNVDYNLYSGDLYFGGGTGPGVHVLTSDPLFVNASAGNFSLQSTSPAINAGDPSTSATVVGAVDLAGNLRIQGGRIDIGAYEAR